MNPNIKRLRTYPFSRLNRNLASVEPPQGKPLIAMHIGEPRHQPPEYAAKILGQGHGLGRYPSSHGSIELRKSCAAALRRRYQLPDHVINPETMVVPVNGTREGLFSFVQASCGAKRQSIVVMPNPFYQIYEGAALLAGAEPYYLNTQNESSLAAQLDAVPTPIWSRCEVLFICSPANPSGHVASHEDWLHALMLADRYDFVIAADECYADIYRHSKAPLGLLDVCYQTGRENLNRCVIFHSLSKRSNIPGLRSGCLVGAENLIAPYREYRDYHGCAMPQMTQDVSIAAWNDDDVPSANRQLYDKKYELFCKPLETVWPQHVPDGAFYLWSATPYDDRHFARDLFAQQHIKTLPGQYLAREFNGMNPGEGRIRISLVPSIDECVEAAARIVEFFQRNNL